VKVPASRWVSEFRVYERPHEADEGIPRIAFVGEHFPRGGDVAAQPVRAQLAQQLLLAGIAAIQRADTDVRPLGHGGDRRGRISDENGPRGIHDELVVTGGLRLPPVYRRRGARSGHDPNVTSERIVPF
jgi:hypothetical protein